MDSSARPAAPGPRSENPGPRVPAGVQAQPRRGCVDRNRARSTRTAPAQGPSGHRAQADSRPVFAAARSRWQAWRDCASPQTHTGQSVVRGKRECARCVHQASFASFINSSFGGVRSAPACTHAKRRGGGGRSQAAALAAAGWLSGGDDEAATTRRRRRLDASRRGGTKRHAVPLRAATGSGCRPGPDVARAVHVGRRTSGDARVPKLSRAPVIP